MANITEKMIQQRIIDWGLEQDDDEDYYTAEQSLYAEQYSVAGEFHEAMNDGVI